MIDMRNTPERIRLMALIRHEHTNYDRLSAFYSVNNAFRSTLNAIIGRLIDEKIDIPKFREQIERLESKVDLTIKRNQKEFIKYQIKLHKKVGYYTDKQALEMAKKQLSGVIRMQQDTNKGIKDRGGVNKYIDAYTPPR